MTTATPPAMNVTRVKDQRTGRTLIKLSSWDDCHCLATYMYLQCVSGDEKYLVMTSNRGGAWQVYRVTIATGEVVPLTNYPPRGDGQSENGIHWVNFLPDGRQVLHGNEQGVMATDVYTLKSRLVAQAPQGWVYRPAAPSLTFDGAKVLMITLNPQGKQFIAQGDLATGRFEPLHELGPTHEHLSHLLGGNLNGQSIITFSPLPDRQNKPDGPPEHRARAWQFNPATGKAQPFLVMPPGFRCTHEFWGYPNKTRLYYHKKTVPTWIPASIESVAADGSDRRVHFVAPDRKLGHSCVSPDGRWLVSDVQDPDSNELHLIDLHANQPEKSEILCWPDSRLTHGQIGHVHPSFSPKGNYVVYTSDKSGFATVYLVPLNDKA